jgi:glutathione synthase/RimK-type ligase-like ATP-grasp enzyme
MAACASTPIPNEKLAVAQDSLRRAEQSGAPEFAPVELATAREKLARAQKAVADHDAQPATMLAEQADIDARLAEATANQQRAHKAATEFDASMTALRQESMRATPPAQ